MFNLPIKIKSDNVHPPYHVDGEAKLGHGCGPLPGDHQPVVQVSDRVHVMLFLVLDRRQRMNLIAGFFVATISHCCRPVHSLLLSHRLKCL